MAESHHTPEANWLDRELKSIKEDSKNWPSWMKPAEPGSARKTGADVVSMKFINASSHEARALHKGRATAILRTMHPQPRTTPNGQVVFSHDEMNHEVLWGDEDAVAATASRLLKCPYGRVDDLLFFREDYASNRTHDGPTFVYKADDPDPHRAMSGFWSPPSKMRDVAVRTCAVIDSINVVRVCRLSEEQLRRLGVEADVVDSGGFTPWGAGVDVADWHTPFHDEYESTHGDGSWEKDWAWFIGLRGRRT